MAKNLVELCSIVLFTACEPIGHETGYLAEEISKQSIEGETWVCLTSYKIREKRDELKKALLSKNKLEL